MSDPVVTQPPQPAGQQVIVRSSYTKDAWLDPWRRPQYGYVVEDLALLVEQTGETEPYDYGYGPQHVAQCPIWRASDGRLFKAIPPMDYGATTRYVDVTTHGSFERLKASTPYVRDGMPVTPEQLAELGQRVTVIVHPPAPEAPEPKRHNFGPEDRGATAADIRANLDAAGGAVPVDRPPAAEEKS